MKNTLNLETKCEEPPSITLTLKEPSSGADRLVTLKFDDAMMGYIYELIDEGLSGALCDALEVEADKPDAQLFVWHLLIRLEIHEHRYEEAARRGRFIRDRKLLHYPMRFIVALAHQYAGRLGEAYAFMAEKYRPAYDYQMACCAARMGWHSVAIGHLIKGTAISDACRFRCVFDEDLGPLWEYFISGEANFRDCVLLASPEMAPCFKLEPPDDKAWGLLDHTDFDRLPERLRSAVKPQLRWASYVPREPGDRGYDAELKNDLHHFRHLRIYERVCRAMDALDYAESVVCLLAEAEKEAEAGNMVCARQLLHAIADSFPNAAIDLEDFCRNEKLRLLAADLRVEERPRLNCRTDDFSKN